MTSRTDYHAILASDTPLIDIRAPVEFSQGVMPAAIDLSLMNDEEHAAIGTCYKYQGSGAALVLSHKPTDGDPRASRIQARLETCVHYSHGYLCCTCGGQRSHIVQQWLRNTGVEYPLIVGGCKALCQAAIQATDELVQCPIVLIGGCTGNNETQLVCSRSGSIDLEGLAHHHGSSFSRTLQDRRPQATFENHLTVSLLKKAEQQAHQVLEDGGHMIGVNHLPECLRLHMAQSPLAAVENPFDVRLERLRKEYFDRMYRDFITAYGEEKGWQAYGEYLHHGLLTIRRRLGLRRFAQLAEQLDGALAQRRHTASTEAYFIWLVPPLKEYYGPMYHYRLGERAGKILFRGSWQKVAAWLAK